MKMIPQKSTIPIVDFKDHHGLTIKERLTVQNYLTNGYNKTQAAISAGYSKDSAKSIAYKIFLKPALLEYMRLLMEEAAAKQGITIDWILGKLREGVNRSIIDCPEELDAEMKKYIMEKTDVRSAVSAISEINKMMGNYAAEKKQVEMTHDVTDELVKKYEKDC